MKFKRAVEQTSEIKDAYCRGLRALRKADKQHVTAEDPRRIRGSVDIDTTVRKEYPNDSRWDYAIGHQPSNVKGEVIYWIEVHPASNGEVKVVIAKLQWLKKWLKESASDLNELRREYIWLASGKTSFTRSSPQQKRIAQQGLQFQGRVFTIPNKAAE